MERKGFIGGSDMNVIMNGDWRKLWLVKTGRQESDDLSNNLAVQLGSYTEQFNINWFKKDLMLIDVLNEQQEFKMLWQGIPLKGTVDAIGTSIRVLEVCI